MCCSPARQAVDVISSGAREKENGHSVNFLGNGTCKSKKRRMVTGDIISYPRIGMLKIATSARDNFSATSRTSERNGHIDELKGE